MRTPSLITLVLLSLISCKSLDKSRPEKQVLFTVGDTPVYSDEFVYVFNKNNLYDSAVTRQSIDEYLDLFVKFKLKIKEAKAAGLHNTDAFINEFSTYKEELAKPYLTETKVVNELVEQAYERLKQEVNASHILIRVEQHAAPEDTAAAYARISEIREKALQGQDFGALAQQYSEDPSAKSNRGNLGYFTALQMVYPFEEQAYTVNAGDISPVFRTRFGYHILKVHDKRPSRGKIKTSHIMIRASEGIPQSDSIAARKKIYEIYEKLKAGALWYDMCQQFSEDLGTKANGGSLPWFGAGNVVPEFEHAAFALQNPGDMTEPVKTPYGWHIIRLDERKALEPFDELKENLTNRIKRDSRSELSRIALISRLKKENNFQEYESAINEAAQSADSSLLRGEWKPSPDLKDGLVLFRIGDSTYTAGGFYKYVTERQSPADGLSAASVMRNLYKDYSENELVAYEKSRLSEKYYDYKMLLKEYEEGILLFQLMDEQVWTRAVNDSTGLKQYYEDHKDQYMWKERADAAIYNASAKEILDTIKNHLQKPYIPASSSRYELIFAADSARLNADQANQLAAVAEILNKNEDWLAMTFSPAGELDQKRLAAVREYLSGKAGEGRVVAGSRHNEQNKIVITIVSPSRKVLEKKFNEKSALDLHIDENIYEKGDNELVDAVDWQKGIYEIAKNDRYYLVEVKEILPPGPKKFEEIRGLVISDYQNHLENIWIEKLRKQYPVTINDNVLRKIYKNLEAI